MNQPTLDLFAQAAKADKVEAQPTMDAAELAVEKNLAPDAEGADEALDAPEPAPPPPRKKPKRRATAQSMAGKHRAIAISEFFTKNRHLLGFDNPAKALLTTVREAVDNALDASEEAGILPDITVEISKVDGESDRFLVLIRDLGPGIVKRQIGKIFGKLLYGSKFHRLKQSRGQQGIGISAAGMYGRITTGKPVTVTTRTGARRPINHMVLQIDTKRNEPKYLVQEELPEWPYAHGTEIILEIGATYKGGRHSVDEFLRQTALSNPHARIHYSPPIGKPILYDRQVHELPFEPEEIQPHPHGIELGILMHMMSDTKQRNLSDFLCNDFCRISERIAEEIIAEAAKGITGRGPKAMMRRSPKAMDRSEAEALYKVLQATELRAPPTNCLSPIGPDEMKAGLFHLFDPGEHTEDEFFVTSETRKPTVYRGNPFQVEVGIVYGKGLEGDKPAGVYRYANRVPLQYQAGACAVTKAVTALNWRQYGLNQPRGSVPVGPMMITVHIASGWMPYTSESKEAIAHYPEILAELRLALQVCARRLQVHLRRRRREADEAKKRAYINNYLPPIAEALAEILKLDAGEQKSIVDNLELIIDDSRGEV
jgi:DNA topoisomerase VI subunit B